MFDPSDTIAAIATAHGGAIRGIVRVSGPAAGSCLQRVFQPVNGENLSAINRPTAFTGFLRTPDPLGSVPCDVYWWPTVRSYTRQPCFEVHTFGSPPILEAIVSSVCQAGCRLAQPGEFTMRAFLAGRLDLTQAEAVLGVIDARDAVELSVALQQLAGGLARPLNNLRDRLLDLLARLEAGLDFVEEDIEFIQAAELRQQLEESHAMVASILDQVSQRTHATAHARVVLRGWPNVGKSSLMNALAGTRAAIVSEHAGTTRDYVAREIELGGIRVQLIDTAGIEGASAGVAQAAQAVAAQQSQEASLQLLCIDGSRPLNRWEKDELAHPSDLRLVVLTKCDLPGRCEYRGPAVRTSCRAACGMGELQSAIRSKLESVRPNDFCIDSTAARCEESLRLASESLHRGIEIVTASVGEELVASELRLALLELGRVAGTVYTDDILDRIFSRFCIGK